MVQAPLAFMRPVLVSVLIVTLLAPLNGSAAETATGAGYGVDGFVASAGGWHAYYFDHAGGTAIVRLAWDASLLGADYDLTLYQVNALNDGALTQSEVISKSWQYRKDLRQEEIIADGLPAGRYVVTVEPIQSLGEAYRLTVNGGLSFAATTVGTKVSLP